MLTSNNTVYDVRGITADEEVQILAFIQGAVYCWAKNKPSEAFALRDLFGGENTIWTDTPLQVLYNRHVVSGKSAEDAHDQAGKDAGWLLKKVLLKEHRSFSCENKGLVNHYTWVP